MKTIGVFLFKSPLPRTPNWFNPQRSLIAVICMRVSLEPLFNESLMSLGSYSEYDITSKNWTAKEIHLQKQREGPQ